jgi:prefoldin subunit 5
MVNLHTALTVNITGTKKDFEDMLNKDFLECIASKAAESVRRAKDDLKAFEDAGASSDISYSVTTGALVTFNVVPQKKVVKPIPKDVMEDAVKAAKEAVNKAKEEIKDNTNNLSSDNN